MQRGGKGESSKKAVSSNPCSSGLVTFFKKKQFKMPTLTERAVLAMLDHPVAVQRALNVGEALWNNKGFLSGLAAGGLLSGGVAAATRRRTRQKGSGRVRKKRKGRKSSQKGGLTIGLRPPGVVLPPWGQHPMSPTDGQRGGALPLLAAAALPIAKTLGLGALGAGASFGTSKLLNKMEDWF